MTVLVAKIQRFSLHDGDGIRTTVFLKGCPLHCRWCHNPETISPGPELMTHFERCIGCKACLSACKRNAIVFTENEHYIKRELCNACGACVETCYAQALTIAGKAYSLSEIMEQIDKDKELYEISGGGVTISGGEPLLHPEFIRELGQMIKEHGCTLFIDTAGFVPFSVFTQINDLVDTYLYDLKSMDPFIHKMITGQDNRQIIANLRRLDNLHKDLVIRMPIMQGINDQEDNIEQASAFLASLKHVREVNLLPIHKLASGKYQSLDQDYSFVEDHPETTGQRIKEISQRFKEKGLNVRDN